MYTSFALPCPIVMALACAAFVMTCAAKAAEPAADFRVDNAVFAEGRKEPLSKSLTLFRAGVVYDFTLPPGQESIVVLQPAARRVVLVDPGRKIRCELTLTELAAYCEKLQAAGAESDDATTRFLAKPRFDTDRDAAKHVWTFGSSLMTYRVQAAATTPTAAERYREFADWTARLNTLLGGRPPFVRLAINEALAAEPVVPSEITVTVTPPAPAKKSVIRSEHKLAMELSAADGDRIERARGLMATARAVTFDEWKGRE